MVSETLRRPNFAVLLGAVWSDRARWCAATAGVLTGLALAVGLESVAYLAMCGAAISARYVFDARAAAALRAYGVALAGATLTAFLLNIDPAHWTKTACDALAINTAAAVIVGAIGLAIAGTVSGERTALRAMTVACAGAAALALFVLIEPRCLGGPFAMADRTLWSVWLTDVREMQPLVRMFARMPVTVVAMAAFPAAALVAAVVLARQPTLRRDFAFLVSVAALLFAAVAMVLAIRVFSYAMWLGMPLVAAAALRLAAVLRLRSRPARFTAVLLLTPTALSVGAMTIADAAGLHDSDSFAPPENRPCFALASYAPLARLPPGLIVTDVRYGPYVLALTPHSVLAAPYHRLSAAIIANQKALVAPVDQARHLLVAAGATYVAVCGPRPPERIAGCRPARQPVGAAPRGRRPVLARTGARVGVRHVHALSGQAVAVGLGTGGRPVWSGT